MMSDFLLFFHTVLFLISTHIFLSQHGHEMDVVEEAYWVSGVVVQVEPLQLQLLKAVTHHSFHGLPAARHF